jgi:hypothetical protein
VESQARCVRSILPGLASGRGTARHSRVVEGQARCRLIDDPLNYDVGIIEDFVSSYPKSFNSGGEQPCISSCVPRRTIASGVGLAIDFNRQTRVTAEEVENVLSGGMLSTEFETAGPTAKRLPKYHFRKRHLASKPTSVPSRSFLRLRCNVLEHQPGPSTMLRMVPLPETSSGRM